MLADKLNVISGQKDACESLYQSYKAINNDSKALKYFERLWVITDSLKYNETSGILQQVDTPSNLYKNPKNVFVAGFIGSPAMNIFKGSLENKILNNDRWGKN